MLSGVKNEESFITLGPDFVAGLIIAFVIQSGKYNGLTGCMLNSSKSL